MRTPPKRSPRGSTSHTSHGETLVYGWRAVAAGMAAQRAATIFYNPHSRNPQTRALIEDLENPQTRGAKTHLRNMSRPALARLCGSERHQDIAANLRIPHTTLDELLACENSIIVLDGVTDSRNLGAIMRTARAFECGGIILPERNSAPLSAAAAKAAAGAAAFLPLLRVVNIARTLAAVKDSGRAIIGMSETATDSIWTADIPSSPCWVFGDEGSGIRALTKKHCDLLLRIPTAQGEAGCLNVSLSTAICLAAAYQNKGHRP